MGVEKKELQETLLFGNNTRNKLIQINNIIAEAQQQIQMIASVFLEAKGIENKKIQLLPDMSGVVVNNQKEEGEDKKE